VLPRQRRRGDGPSQQGLYPHLATRQTRIGQSSDEPAERSGWRTGQVRAAQNRNRPGPIASWPTSPIGRLVIDPGRLVGSCRGGRLSPARCKRGRAGGSCEAARSPLGGKPTQVRNQGRPSPVGGDSCSIRFERRPLWPGSAAPAADRRYRPGRQLARPHCNGSARGPSRWRQAAARAEIAAPGIPQALILNGVNGLMKVWDSFRRGAGRGAWRIARPGSTGLRIGHSGPGNVQ
jgi:hypothetical protein